MHRIADWKLLPQARAREARAGENALDILEPLRTARIGRTDSRRAWHPTAADWVTNHPAEQRQQRTAAHGSTAARPRDGGDAAAFCAAVGHKLAAASWESALRSAFWQRWRRRLAAASSCHHPRLPLSGCDHGPHRRGNAVQGLRKRGLVRCRGWLSKCAGAHGHLPWLGSLRANSGSSATTAQRGTATPAYRAGGCATANAAGRGATARRRRAATAALEAGGGPVTG